MLNLNPVSLIFGENGNTSPATIADVNYTPHDFTVTVMALPSHGAVTKEDGITQIHLGQTVTAISGATVTLSGTYTKDFYTQPVPGLGSYDCSGYWGSTCGAPVPHWP